MEIKVREGDPFPALRGETHTGEWFDLSELLDARKVIYFYPKDNTPGCTIEAQQFNASLADFEQRNVRVIGVSADTAESHKTFCDAHDLGFTLVADKDAAVCKELGIYVTLPGFEQFGPFPQRVTFLLDEGNVVRRVWVVKDIVNHPNDVLRALETL